MALQFHSATTLAHKSQSVGSEEDHALTSLGEQKVTTLGNCYYSIVCACKVTKEASEGNESMFTSDLGKKDA